MTQSLKGKIAKEKNVQDYYTKQAKSEGKKCIVK